MSDTFPPRSAVFQAFGGRTAAVVIGGAALCWFAVRTAARGSIPADVRAFQTAYLVAFAGYALIAVVLLKPGRSPGTPSPLVRFASRHGWWIICVLLRLILLRVTPTDDAYRYVWEGRVQQAGFNPYAHAPDDPRLLALRDDDWTCINHPDYPAIYGPLAELQFRLAAALDPSPQCVKLFHVVADVCVLFLLASCLRRTGRPPALASLYGLCPLVLTAFAVEGHLDSLMLLMLLFAVRFQQEDRTWPAGAALGAALAVKITAGFFVPWFLWRRPRVLLPAMLVVGLCWIPYLDAGAGIATSLLRFAGGPPFFSLISLLPASWTAAPAVKAVNALLLLGILLRLAGRNGSASFSPFAKTNAAARSVGTDTDGLDTYAFRAASATTCLLPVLHYWYLTWVLVFLPFRTVRERPAPPSGSDDADPARAGDESSRAPRLRRHRQQQSGDRRQQSRDRKGAEAKQSRDRKGAEEGIETSRDRPPVPVRGQGAGIPRARTDQGSALPHRHGRVRTSSRSPDGPRLTGGPRRPMLLPWLAMSAAMVVYFEAERLRVAAGTWSMPSWCTATVWASLAAGVGLELVQRRLRIRFASALDAGHDGFHNASQMR
ncbi:MAG: DUF2029 domain-containing protein [Planctomycetota bacterium]|nr:MAG: DUF2029 domain-containing protein [Planctomycetota bacterium]